MNKGDKMKKIKKYLLKKIWTKGIPGAASIVRRARLVLCQSRVKGGSVHGTALGPSAPSRKRTCSPNVLSKCGASSN